MRKTFSEAAKIASVTDKLLLDMQCLIETVQLFVAYLAQGRKR